jgi:tRNA G10  N-methylase Trm11
MQSLFILGRQPALGLAELESLYGTDTVQPTAGTPAATLDVPAEQIDFDRLGGSMKFGKLLIVLDTTDWRDIEQFLVGATPHQAAQLNEGKLTIGISAYGLKVSPAAIQATGLKIKKAVRKSGRSVRLVPNKDIELNTAQVLHNHLTGDHGWELLLVRDGRRTILAQTLRVQDIESYTVRDRERPKRDARVGMLPPKLAQILINLAVGRLTLGTTADYMEEDVGKTVKTTPAKDSKQAVEPAPAPESAIPTTILDPFCGTGVVLQEALLTGYAAYGTDIDPRMIEYTKENIEWLKHSFAFGDIDVTIEIGDATTHRWTHPFTHVASETYLGRPFTSLPAPDILHQTVSECSLIIKKFLKNIGGQIPAGTRLCLAVPAWQTRTNQFKHLPLLDSLEKLGYNRISFEHVRNEDLLYYRSDQVVARELLVLVKK